MYQRITGIAFLLAFAFAIALPVQAEKKDTLPLITIIPFTTYDKNPASDITIFSRTLERQLPMLVQGVTLTSSPSIDSLTRVCSKEDPVSSEKCLIKLSTDLNVNILITGSLETIGHLNILTVRAFDANKKAFIWSLEYQSQTSVEDLYLTFKDQGLSEIASLLNGEKNVATALNSKIKRSSSVNNTKEKVNSASENGSIEEVNEYFIDTTLNSSTISRLHSDPDIAIVTGPTFGVMFRTIIGTAREDASQFGGQFMFLYPSSARSHFRGTFGIPMTKKEQYSSATSLANSDLQFSLENEWGFENFGIGIGGSYCYMPRFTQKDDYYSYSEKTFPDRHSLNYLLSLRGGKANSGFRGKICWPIPFLLKDPSTDSWFFEYSAMGIFGSSLIKGGVGIQGGLRQRYTSYTTNPSSPYQSSYSSSVTQTSYFIMLPCGKVAIRTGDHGVFTLSGDLGSLIFPSDSNGPPWTPNIMLQYVYSLGKLKGPSALDGSF